MTEAPHDRAPLEGHYPLGHSPDEARRLAAQALQLESFTEDVLRRAGLRPGLEVLDLGSGVGDMALLAARLVGNHGSVLGVERAASSVEAATRRAAELGVDNVAFVAGDLATFVPERSFDAIIGRFVLSYLPDRVALLKRLARHLRPGGIVVFLEVDLTSIAQVPPSDLFAQARGWLLAGFATGGTELEMGSRLHATFRQVGLPAPGMIAVQPVFGGGEAVGYVEMVQALRSLLPAMARDRIADVDRIGIDTLAERLRADAAANERVAFMSRLIAAWARLP